MEKLVFPLSRKEADGLGEAYSPDINKSAAFPSLLREKRKAAGLSQAELAEKIGVTKSTIGLYETGENVPDIKTLSKLADFYDVSADYLLCRTEFPNASDNDIKINEIIGLSSGAIEALEYVKQRMPHLMPIFSELCDNKWYLITILSDIQRYRDVCGAIDEIRANHVKEGQNVIPNITVELSKYKRVDKTSSNPLGVKIDKFFDTHNIKSAFSSVVGVNNLSDIENLMACAIRDTCLEWINSVLKDGDTNAEKE